MSELNVKFGDNQRAIPAPATVADAIKAFDRDALKKALAAKVNGEEVDLNHELTATDESYRSSRSLRIRTTALRLFAIRPLICLLLRYSICFPEQSSVSARR